MFALYFEWNMSKKKKKSFTDLIKYIYQKVFMAFKYLENFALARLFGSSCSFFSAHRHMCPLF